MLEEIFPQIFIFSALRSNLGENTFFSPFIEVE